MKCPYCNSYNTVTDENNSSGKIIHFAEGKYKNLQFAHTITWCLNPDCGEIILNAELIEGVSTVYHFTPERTIKSWNLLPESSFIPLPGYIPTSIKEDYQEACLILNLSPKASATLSRRCLQGMIRDFWRINEKTLYLEVEKLKEKIEIDLFNAIHSIRSIGNIGAHPERDTSTIVEIESGEAKELINLIEILFKEWYFTREDRKKRLEAIQAISESKKCKEINYDK